MQLVGVEAVTNRGRIFASDGTVALYDAVCASPDVDGAVKRADASSDALSDCIGVVTFVLGDGRVLVEGRTGVKVTNPAWTWTRGDRLFLEATPGQLSTSPPQPSPTQFIAEAVSATTIVLHVGQTWRFTT